MTVSAKFQDDFVVFATALAHLARQETVAYFRQSLDITSKAKPYFDPVTEADKAAERVIRHAIEQTYPDHGILGEEEEEKAAAGPFRWVIDPIDGTRAFINGVASWTTLIALEYEEQPFLGLIDQPITDDIWVGIHNQYTVLNNNSVTHSCRTRQKILLPGARISTTDPLPSVYFSQDEAAGFAAIAARAQFARYGLDGYGYGILAMGGLDLIIETGLAHYDAAAVIPIITGAGGVICDWSGKNIDQNWALPPSKGGTGGQILAAGNAALLEEVMPHLSSLAVEK